MTVESGPFELKRFTNDGKLIVSLKAKNQCVCRRPERAARRRAHIARSRRPHNRDHRRGDGCHAAAEGRRAHRDGEDDEGRQAQRQATASLVTSDQASYDQRSGVVTILAGAVCPGERLSGSGVGATYDKNRDVLWLLDQATMKIAPATRRAVAARKDRRSRRVWLEPITTSGSPKTRTSSAKGARLTPTS